MDYVFDQPTQLAVGVLLSSAPRVSLGPLVDGLEQYLLELADLRPAPPRGYQPLAALARFARDFLANSVAVEPAASTPDYDYDHDYAGWHRLARSLWFNWGDRGSGWTAEAMAPTYWSALGVLAHSDRKSAFRMAEVGAGTGRLSYEVARHRRNASFVVTDVSMESLALASVLYTGSAFDVPRRTNFDDSPTGITWFDCQAPEPLSEVAIECRVASLPAGSDYDFIVACNALSLFPDPMLALEQLVEKLAPNGRLFICDLYCWRVETPALRRTLGPGAVAEALRRLGCVIESVQPGLSYSENWGHERTYVWSSHAISARCI